MKSQNLKTGFIAMLAVILALAAPSRAWRILTADPVPPNSVALCLTDRGILCGYRGDDGGILRELDSEDGDILGTIDAPEDRCYGLAREGQRFWFIGSQFLTLIDSRGSVIRQIEKPYETMHGLAANEEGFWTFALINDEFYLISFEPGGNEQSRVRTAFQNPTDITWDGEFLWITDIVDGFIHKYDPVQNSEIDILPSPMYAPTGIVCDIDRILLIDHGPTNEFNVLYNIDPVGEVRPRLMPISRHFDFGIVDIIEAPAINFALFNVGGEDLVVEDVDMLHNNMNGFRMGDVAANTVVPPGEFMLVPVTFSPRNYLHYFDTLVVRSNDPEEPVMMTVFQGLGTFHSRRLGFWPDSINFGSVRADPWRDGTRLVQVAVFNESQEPLLVDSLNYRIRDIFYFDQSDLPRELETAETLWVNGWFTPHRGITYLDTLIVFSNQLQRAFRVPMRGTGSDSVFVAGTTLWWHSLEEGQGVVGAGSRISDINNDGIRDAAVVGPTGIVYGLSGFGSAKTDVFWSQDFRNQPYSPVGVHSDNGITANCDLNGDGYIDVILGSGEVDRAVYGIDGRDGRLLWRWDARSIGGEGPVKRLIAGDDVNGDGAADPIVLLYLEISDVYRLARLNGSSGRAAWAHNPGSVVDVALIDDFSRDGVADVVCIDADNHIKTFNGVDGALMEMFDAECSPPILPVQDLDNDGWRDLITGAPGGAVSGWSIARQRRLWNLDAIEDQVLPEPLQFIIESGADYDNDGASELFIASGEQWLFCLNPRTGQPLWLEDIARVVTISIHADNNSDGFPDILTGTETGLVFCLDGVNGSLLWSFDRRGLGSVSKVFSFDDVDLGGTPDAVAIFSDGEVLCISSGGDVGIPQREYISLSAAEAAGVLTPNPFNGDPNLRFRLDRQSRIVVDVWDLNGRLIGSQDLGGMQRGWHNVPLRVFEQGEAPAGVYFIHVSGLEVSMIIRGVYLK